MTSEVQDDGVAAITTDAKGEEIAQKTTSTRKKSSRRATKKPANGSVTPAIQAARRPGRKPYPVVVFEEALKIPQGIMQHASGYSVRRLTLLDLMNLNPTTQATRDLITNSGKYNLTIGNHSAEELKLTEKGRVVVDTANALQGLGKPRSCAK